MAARLNLEGVTVLVAEDHEDSREVVCGMVRSYGATAHGARDGMDALAKIVRNKPDLIFCDLRMPRMDGFDLLERLRSDPKLCRIPVVVISRLSEHADMMRTWNAGFSGHLVKPVELDALAAQLERVFWAHPRS